MPGGTEGGWAGAATASKLTIKPARILGIPKGTLRVGVDADVTIIDPHLPWKIDVDHFVGKSRNCPFQGWHVKGRAVATIVGGDVKWKLK